MVVSRNPRAFAGGARSLDGGEWIVAGERWRLNPRVAVPPAFFHLVQAWNRCRAGMGGYAVLPEPGGLNAQPAWLMRAFAHLSGVEAELAELAAADAAGNTSTEE